ncbi:MAG: hypothetical protein ACRET1_00300 [Burkholderiales bacterium]
MNKKLIVLTVAGALAVPFVASAKSTVQIYGKARVGYIHADSGDGINSGDTLFDPAVRRSASRVPKIWAAAMRHGFSWNRPSNWPVPIASGLTVTPVSV